MRKASVTNALASIGRAAKQNLTPKSKAKKERRKRRSRDDSLSSPASSYDESYYSDLSESSDFSSSYSEESREVDRHSRGRRGRVRRHHRSRGDRRHYGDRDRRRGRRRGRESRHSPDSYGAYTPNRHLKNPTQHVDDEDAAQMVDLLMRIMPFYGKGDGNSDAVVVDTIHRLPPGALEMQDVDGNTLLMLACQSEAEAPSLVPLLLSKGCNVNTRNSVGASCLHFACFVESWNPDAAMSLIRHGALAEVAETEFGCTPLHWAAFSGHVELCASLCRAGGNPRTLDKNGCSPIHYAEQNGHTACVKLLGSFLTSESGAPSSLATAGPAASPGNPPDKSEWVRCLDGSTGSSFYHNKDTGESLWGEDYRKVDEVAAPPSRPLREDESKDAGGDDVKASTGTESEEGEVVQETGSAASETLLQNAPLEESAEMQVPPDEIDLDTCQHRDPRGELSGNTLSKLTAIEEDIDETSITKNDRSGPGESQHAPLHEPEHDSQLDTIDDVVETSSIEDDEPALPMARPECVSNVDTATSNSDGLGDNSGKKPNLARLNSWDADFYASEPSLPQKLPDTSEAQEDDQVSGKCHQDDRGTGSNTDHLLARNQSFEQRIASLHQKMESTMMHRLQHLEDKLMQQTLETSTKVVEDDSSENLAEMATTILHLRTEIGTKDLEILALKQKVVKMETEKIVKDASVRTTGVGDGNVHVDSVKDENEKLLAAKDGHAQELEEAKSEIARLKESVDEARKSLKSANGRYEQAQRHREIAEKLARDEKASMKALFEQSQKGEGDSALLQQEKYHAEETILQLKEQIRTNEDKALQEKDDHQQEVESLTCKLLETQAHATRLENNLKETVAKHDASVAEMNDRHKEDLDEAKRELDGVRSELGDVQERLKSASLLKMEMMVAKDEAVDAMESALEEARVAQAKLQEMTDLIKSTEELKKSNERLHHSLQDETEKRKVLHNTLEDMKGRIRVYVRVRPLSQSELSANYENVLSKEDERTCIMAADPASGSAVRDWEFDKIFHGRDADGNSQENVFKDTSLLLTSAIDGFNVCIFAYGQTGAGKTYTMLGDSADDKHQGLAPRVAHELFRKLAERESSQHIEVTASMLELYTDKLRDLLVSEKNDSECIGDLKIRLAEHTSSGLVEVDGAKIERVANAEELLAVFDRGTRARKSSSTKMNAESSRSHMIATIVLSLRNRRTGKMVRGKLTLVDLAGSERVSKSGATGHQLKEAQSINKSLSALGDVIGALTSGGRQHIPYRNHPLTMLMSDSIGGNSKTLMFVCASPADFNRNETANSLDFAKRCRNVTNNVQPSAKGTQSSQIRALRAELSKAKAKGSGAPKRRPMRSPGTFR